MMKSRFLLIVLVIIIIPLELISGQQDNFQKLEYSIARINSLNSKGDVLESGSGAIILIKKNRILALTARHVVDNPLARAIDIVTEDGNTIKAKLFGVNEELDFAILESLPDQNIPQNLRCLIIKKKSKYEPTTKIVVAAFQKDSNKLSFHKGNINNIEDSFVRYYLENDYTLIEGESGSPLLDNENNIIGLNHGRSSGKINLAIRIDLIEKILEEWKIPYTKPRKVLPAISSAIAATSLGILSLRFHSESEAYLYRYNTAITQEDIQHYWRSAETDRKRGNVAALLSYAAVVFTGYQLWRNNYIPFGKSPCYVGVRPIGKYSYALNTSISLGMEFIISF